VRPLLLGGNTRGVIGQPASQLAEEVESSHNCLAERGEGAHLKPGGSPQLLQPWTEAFLPRRDEVIPPERRQHLDREVGFSDPHLDGVLPDFAGAPSSITSARPRRTS
jgi:hypothetical protein